jgi:leader peptidase (prepilin peptidase)/N-methyltransferase
VQELFPTPLFTDTAVQTRPRPAIIGAAAVMALALAAWTWSVTGIGAAMLLFLYLAIVTLPLCVWDLARHRLPNTLVLPGYAIAAVELLWLALTGKWPWIALAAGAGWFGFFFLLAAAGGMGMGDVKLAGLIGVALGALSPTAALVGPMIAFLTGGVAGLAVAVSPELRHHDVPFGPYLLLGLWTAPAFT